MNVSNAQVERGRRDARRWAAASLEEIDTSGGKALARRLDQQHSLPELQVLILRKLPATYVEKWREEILYSPFAFWTPFRFHHGNPAHISNVLERERRFMLALEGPIQSVCSRIVAVRRLMGPDFFLTQLFAEVVYLFLDALAPLEWATKFNLATSLHRPNRKVAEAGRLKGKAKNEAAVAFLDRLTRVRMDDDVTHGLLDHVGLARRFVTEHDRLASSANAIWSAHVATRRKNPQDRPDFGAHVRALGTSHGWSAEEVKRVIGPDWTNKRRADNAGAARLVLAKRNGLNPTSIKTDYARHRDFLKFVEESGIERGYLSADRVRRLRKLDAT